MPQSKGRRQRDDFERSEFCQNSDLLLYALNRISGPSLYENEVDSTLDAPTLSCHIVLNDAILDDSEESPAWRPFAPLLMTEIGRVGFYPISKCRHRWDRIPPYGSFRVTKMQNA